MPRERSSAGDPARTLELLWRDRNAAFPAAPSTGVSTDPRAAPSSGPSPGPSARPRRGPRPGLDLERLIDTSIGLADREGLPAVSMRRIAHVLGIAAMTVYTYVPGKAELLDLMLDAVYARMARVSTAGEHWRRRLTGVADENRALFAAHPWVCAVSTLRPTLGPGAIAKYEHELAALDGLGLTDVEMDDCLTHLLLFVEANARAAADADSMRRETSMDDQQWWARVGPVLARFVGIDGHDSRYPLATRVGTAAGSAHAPEHAYRFGLARVLDGLAALIDRPEAD